MKSSNLNDQILKSIRENCRGDEEVEKFLIELICEEVEHANQWWWKDTYRKKIKNYSDIWSNKNEIK